MLLKYYQKLDDAISYLAGSFCNEKKLIKSILGNKKIYYADIGTNLGSYIDFLSSFYSFKEIYSFEPIGGPKGSCNIQPTADHPK